MDKVQLRIARYNRQLHHLKKIIPIAAKVWGILKKLDITLIDGNNYRFTVVENKNSAQLQISRNQGSKLIRIVTLNSLPEAA